MSQVEIKDDSVEDNANTQKLNENQSAVPVNLPVKLSLIQRLKTVPKRLVASKLDASRLAFEAAVVALLVIFIVHDGNINKTNHNLNAKLSSYAANPQKLVSQSTQSTLNKVGKLMQLPTGQTPEIATVSNLAAAKKESAFFNNAKQGDEVLLYVKSKEAILYRPSTNKIILVAPLNFSASSTTSN